MPLTDATKIDSIFKRSKNVALTDTSKQFYSETVAGGFLTDGTDVLADPLPFNDPAAAILAGLVADKVAAPLALTHDVTVASNKCWQARSIPGDISSSMLVNWIPYRFGIAYTVRLYNGDPSHPLVHEILTGDASSWFFDEKSGVLIFQNAAPALAAGETAYFITGYYYTGRTVMDIAPATGYWTRSTAGGIQRLYPADLGDAVVVGASTLTAGDILRVVGKSKFEGPVDSINQANVEDAAAFRVLFDVPEITTPATHTSGYEVKLNSVNAGTDPGLAVCGFFYQSAIANSSPMVVYPFIFEHLMNDSNPANGYYGTLSQAGSGTAKFLNGYITATGTGDAYGLDLQVVKTAGSGGSIVGGRLVTNVSAGISPVQVYGQYLQWNVASKAGGGTARVLNLSVAGAATVDQGIYCTTASPMTSFVYLAGAGAVGTAFDSSTATNVSVLLEGGTVNTANYAVNFTNSVGSGYQATFSGSSVYKRGVNLIHTGLTSGYAAFASSGSWARGVYLASNFGTTSGVTYAWAINADYRLGTPNGYIYGSFMDLRDVCSGVGNYLQTITGAYYSFQANQSTNTAIIGVQVDNVSAANATTAHGFHVSGNWQDGIYMADNSARVWAIDCGSQSYNGIRVTNAATSNASRYAMWLSSAGTTTEGSEGTSGGTLYAAATRTTGTAGTFVNSAAANDNAIALRAVNANGTYAKFYGHNGPRTRSGVVIRGQTEGFDVALLDIQPRSGAVGANGIIVKNFEDSTNGTGVYPLYVSQGANVNLNGGSPAIIAFHLNNAQNPSVLNFNPAICGIGNGAYGIVGSCNGYAASSLSATYDWNGGVIGVCQRSSADDYTGGVVGLAVGAARSYGVIGRSYCTINAIGDPYSAGVLGIATATNNQYTCGVRAEGGRFALYAAAEDTYSYYAGYFNKGSKAISGPCVYAVNYGSGANAHGVQAAISSNIAGAAAIYGKAANAGATGVWGLGGSVAVRGTQNLATGAQAGYFEKSDNTVVGTAVYIANNMTTGLCYGVQVTTASADPTAAAGMFNAVRGARGVYIYGNSTVDSAASGLHLVWTGQGAGVISEQYGIKADVNDCYGGIYLDVNSSTAANCSGALIIQTNGRCNYGVYVAGGNTHGIYSSTSIRSNTKFNLNGTDGYGAVGGSVISFATAGGKVATMTLRGGIITNVTFT